MASTPELESTLTDRYQTTVPEAVREALGLSKRDKIHYTIKTNGVVVLTRASNDNDPAIEPFLALLARDMQEHPEALRAVDAAWLERVRTLVEDLEIDLDAPLPDDT